MKRNHSLKAGPRLRTGSEFWLEGRCAPASRRNALDVLIYGAGFAVYRSRWNEKMSGAARRKEQRACARFGERGLPASLQLEIGPATDEHPCAPHHPAVAKQHGMDDLRAR